MDTPSHDWLDVRDRIVAILTRHESSLSQETVDGVMHYVRHDEYGLALEGLCIDLLAGSVPGVDWNACLKLALELDLEENAVLDSELVSKLTALAGES